MRTLDVGLDLDGVCYDFVGALRRHLACHRGVPVASMGPALRWEFYLDWGLTAAEFRTACDVAVGTGALFWDGDPYPDTDWALHTLAAAGHRLHIITARHFGATGVAKQATKTWLHRTSLPYDSLTVTDDKTTVACDVVLDDCPANYDAVTAAGGLPYLFTRPWNRTHPGRSVGTWQEFVDVVDRLAHA